MCREPDQQKCGSWASMVPERPNALQKQGVLLEDDGAAYFGDLQDGCRHGFGTNSYADGSLYEGEWCQGVRHGAAREISSHGQVRSGCFSNGVRQGHWLLAAGRCIPKRTAGGACMVERELWQGGELVNRDVVVLEAGGLEFVYASAEEALASGRFPQPSTSSSFHLDNNMSRRLDGCRCGGADGVGSSSCATRTAGKDKDLAANPVEAWTAEEVHRWLCESNLQSCSGSSLLAVPLTGQELCALDHDALEVHFRILRYGTRCKILHAIRLARAANSGSASKGYCSYSARATSSTSAAGIKRLLAFRHEEPYGCSEHEPNTSAALTGLRIQPRDIQLSLPDGGTGELLPAGIGLARGLLHRPRRSCRGMYFGKEVSVEVCHPPDVKQHHAGDEAANLAWKRELKLLQSLRHPGLVSLLGLTTGPVVQAVFEYIAPGYSLHNLLEQVALTPTVEQLRPSELPPTATADGVHAGRLLERPYILRLAQSIAAAVHYLHKRFVWHWSLRPSVVYVYDGASVKLGEYTAQLLQRAALSQSMAELRLPQLTACTLWTAPEVLRATALCKDVAAYGRGDGRQVEGDAAAACAAGAVDVYAFGVILWQLVSRQRPSDYLQLRSVAQLIIIVGFAKRHLRPYGDLLALLSDDFRSVMKASLSHTPGRRPAFSEVLAALGRELEAEEGAACEDALLAFFGA
eukprot:TRINITY_DN52095_c0_g1_i1.p1 TRINITY_DN52095_c0_g1~~TRINITY_DN52095_c0_g1_i1.p1  ORF type:complete len:691 (-),score=83.20 TRINITY_DN52095_c0_g1_i1:22-2094(-)